MYAVISESKSNVSYVSISGSEETMANSAVEYFNRCTNSECESYFEMRGFYYETEDLLLNVYVVELTPGISVDMTVAQIKEANLESRQAVQDIKIEKFKEIQARFSKGVRVDVSSLTEGGMESVRLMMQHIAGMPATLRSKAFVHTGHWGTSESMRLDEAIRFLTKQSKARC